LKWRRIASGLSAETYALDGFTGLRQT